MAGLLAALGRITRAIDRFFADPEYVEVPAETLRVSDIVVTLDIPPPSWYGEYYMSEATLAAIRAWIAESEGPREMHLADLYAYRQFGWYQFGWPVLPIDWYSDI